MFRKIILLFSLTMTSYIYAQTCPSVHDIKQNKTPGWKFYDSEDETLLSEKQTADYRKMVMKFVLAEYKKNPSRIHCYYSDNDGSGLEAYLGKANNFKVEKSKNWYQVTGAAQCVAGNDQCRFNAIQPKRLAHR